MANQAERGQGRADQAGKGPAQPKLVWDDSKMTSTYSNVANVAGGREEIVLLFGVNQTWHSGEKNIQIQLSNRIVMSPYAAKRLSLLLNGVLADYEKRFGAIGIEQRPADASIQ
jgi:hypothetical protein